MECIDIIQNPAVRSPGILALKRTCVPALTLRPVQVLVRVYRGRAVWYCSSGSIKFIL